MDVRQEILRQATRLFAAHGFDGASLKDIAVAVGVRKPSLLYHFASKEKLRLAVLDEVLVRWGEVLPRLLMVAAGGDERFNDLMKECVGFFTEDPDRARLVLRELLDRPADMSARLETHVQPWVGAIADYVRRGQEDGEVHADVDPEAYVLQMINLIVCGVACASSLQGGLLPSKSTKGKPSERHTRELLRIARYSLFRSAHREELGQSNERASVHDDHGHHRGGDEMNAIEE
jgi:TetR/AcrR family transcriptional regulator